MQENFDITRLTFEQGGKIYKIEMQGSNLNYNEFMDMIESLVQSTEYTEREVNEYILKWAADIRASFQN